jgi:hypothetical protein
VFEMVNQENGGSKSIENNVVVYNIVSEKPSPVYSLLTYDEEKIKIRNDLEKDIVTNLLSGNKQEMARAAYIAVSLDMANDLNKKFPKQWKEACYNLSGYWKVMSNIFHSAGFKSLLNLKAKFTAAGFVPMNAVAEAEVLYSDMQTWKDPRSLYSEAKKK